MNITCKKKIHEFSGEKCAEINPHESIKLETRKSLNFKLPDFDIDRRRLFSRLPKVDKLNELQVEYLKLGLWQVPDYTDLLHFLHRDN